MRDQRRNPGAPWLTGTATSIIASWLRGSDKGLEWGSGRSTLWFAGRSSHLTSIEHDVHWASWVNARLVGDLKGRVSYFVDPDGIHESAESSYVNRIQAFADESLDYCLVDGLARDHCALASLDKLRPGGLLIVDNANCFFPRVLPLSTPGFQIRC